MKTLWFGVMPKVRYMRLKIAVHTAVLVFHSAGTWVIELLAGITVLKFVLMVWLLMCQPFMNAQ
ncbi:Uncharacterised protein [Acinetobacter baumannii]|nr:Uncharacterised protein [Acinetobacter baumannii]